MRDRSVPWYVVVLVLTLIVAGCTREGKQAVAVVDGERISADEFRTRYKAYLESTGIRDNIVARKQVLENMVSERLIDRDIRRQGFDDREDFRRRVREIELQALLDGYARRVSSDTITVSEEETREEFRRYQTKVAARYLYSTTVDGALDLKQRLERGESFEKLAREVFEDPGLATSGGSLGTFGWGDMEGGIEEAAYTLPLGKVSDPVRIGIGYAVVRVDHRKTVPLASEYDYARVKEVLSRAIVDRKTRKLIEEAGHRVAENLNAEFDERVLGEVYAYVSPALNPPSVQEVSIPVDSLPDALRGEILVRFTSGSWTVKRFVEAIDWTTERQRKRVKSIEDVKSVAIGLATREELLERARREGLEDDSVVVQQRDRLEREHRLRYWASTVQDTIGRSGWDERILRQEYAARREELVAPPEVNVAEILVRTLKEAEALRARLRKGEPFDELARRHSVRLWAGAKGGELGFGTRSTFGPLGDKFLAAKVGELIGPEHVDPYYGLFKILGRHEGRSLKFEEARASIEAMLTESRKREVLKEAIGSLRSTASVSLDLQVLEYVTL